MRKIYFLLLLVYGFGFGQANLSGTARYHLSITGYMGRGNDGCGDIDGLRNISFKYINNSGFSTFWDGRVIDNSINHSIDYYENNKITDILIHKIIRWKNWAGNCDGGPSDRDNNISITPDFSHFFGDVGDGLRGLSITSTPIIDLKNSQLANNILGTDSPLKISTIDGVAAEFFQWEYYILGDDTPYTVWVPDPDCEGGSPILLNARIIDPDYPPIDCPDIPETSYKPNWRKFPAQYQGINSLSIDLCKNVFPTSALGKTITIRANSNAKGTNLIFKYNTSAPHIVSADPVQTKCFDSKDGRLKLKISRKLVSGETLTCAIKEILTDTEVYSTPDGESITIGDDLTYEVPFDFMKGNYNFKLLGWYKNAEGYGANTYVMDPEHQANFTISSPTAVGFSIAKKNDIRCFNGKDGEIEVTAWGGTDGGIYQYSTDRGTTWSNFTNGTKHTLSGLSLGYCYVKVRKLRDANDTAGCIAKLPNESVKELSEEIKQPPALVIISYTSSVEPTFHGGANGKIVASITGGTLINGNSYTYQWKRDDVIVDQSKSSTEFSGGIYAITLNNIPAGTYTLTVQDNNYSTATDKAGCTLNPDPLVTPSFKTVLGEPDAIVITLTETQSISCNTGNLDPITGNPSKLSDGVITALVKGGVPLAINDNNGLLYYYTWSKLNAITNQWEVLTDFTGVSATSLSKGSYSLNVKDKKGITQGTYNTTELVTAIPTEKTLVEPIPLGLTFATENISCHNGNNGTATANVSGGTGGYHYKWSTGATTQTINGLNANDGNEYYVTITDDKGCSTQGGILITEPASPVSLNYTTVTNPTFSGATNGRIVVEVIGGTPKDDNSYGYVWKNKANATLATTSQFINGKFSITLNGVPADEYFLTVWDKNYDVLKAGQVVNCSVLNSSKILEQPKPLVVTFEVVRTISCNASNEFGSTKDTAPADGKRDESQDGILVAHVTGGIQLLTGDNNGLPYFFYWKKQQPNGIWVAWDDQDETAEHLSQGNYALNIIDRNGIVLGSYGVNNELITAKDSIQFMKEPSLFDVSIAKGDVYCNGGNDGWATATVVGGTTPYQYDWSNGETISENTVLKAGDYSIVINDYKKCIAKDKVTILEPIDPITLNYTDVINPTFYKATNGKIVVEVKGGTPFANKSYGYEWKNSAGNLQTATSQVINGVYTLTLNGLAEDVYTLTIKDANYNLATNKIGCTIINSQKTLDDPDPIVVTFEVKRTISCNVSNEFGNEIDRTPKDGQRDESQDGILVAHVSGGIPLTADQNNGLPYFYTWKKQVVNKSWISWNDHDETAENLSNGIYALNIEDKNGIKLGTYVNNLLTTEIDVTQAMPEPPKLEVTFTKFDVGCTVGNDGWAKANVTGGTAPYTYQWTNEGTTDKIENLTTNNYFVIITDAKGCSVQGSVFVGDPNGIIATETTKNPTCFQGNDGTINLDVKGGNLPYTYKWNTGATTKDVNQLKAGNYEVAITCPDCCVYKKYFTLKDPAPIVVNLGSNRTLCNAQSLDLDATILDTKAQYSWTATNGFTANTPKVNLTKAGIYHVKVTSGLGCIGEDDIEIKTNNIDINSEFFLSSQAYLDEEVILVNASNPFGENTQWILPDNVNVVEQKEKFITLKFNKTGVYTIALKQTQGDCYALYSKNISVEPRSTLPNATTTNTHFISDFIVSPNPNDGNFNALINLESNSPINLRLFSYNGQYTLVQKKDSGKKNYAVGFNVKLASGVYVLVLETAQQTLVKKISIY
ncbi:T9SS type A sorting domain-containing protein [Flavobacterium sp. ZT3R18]|uniref:T9SS type A sorting domain-containing protein n=1 Tax=Flavobacterium sp. ZT3R18 TaxID=2594429 RepID=UPI00117A83DE|nr:T9SS type A sorting domain-containing protein [Flavobacterium sp. ZT3R18]TRX35440.1 T9SS type A sorting domain-containing protein [Flavobacterium sp. ZT3R18]